VDGTVLYDRAEGGVISIHCYDKFNLRESWLSDQPTYAGRWYLDNRVAFLLLCE
jgi:hypothetical protein